MRPPQDAELALPVTGEPPAFRTRALRILWPSFVMAGVLEALVFVVVDPLTLSWFGADRLDWSASAIYSVTFLIFWGLISTSTTITCLLEEPGPGRRP